MKTEKTSLYELGEEYEKHVKIQKHFINRCKKEIEKAKESGDYTAVKELERNLRMFYKIKYEIEQTALQLKNYYKK
ncbi:MAG: hypothetical protein IJZ16_14565 [Clostridia bacterium]|nr:hypothetical protein [Clostridia bacterium]